MKPDLPSLMALILALASAMTGYRIAQPTATISLNAIRLQKETYFSMPSTNYVVFQPTVEGPTNCWLKIEIPDTARDRAHHAEWREHPSTTPEALACFSEATSRAWFDERNASTASRTVARFPEFGFTAEASAPVEFVISAGIGSRTLTTARVTCILEPSTDHLVIYYGREAGGRLVSMSK